MFTRAFQKLSPMPACLQKYEKNDICLLGIYLEKMLCILRKKKMQKEDDVISEEKLYVITVCR